MIDRDDDPSVPIFGIEALPSAVAVKVGRRPPAKRVALTDVSTAASFSSRDRRLAASIPYRVSWFSPWSAIDRHIMASVASVAQCETRSFTYGTDHQLRRGCDCFRINIVVCDYHF